MERKELVFPLGECKTCHHVQCIRTLTELDLRDLYFSNNAPPSVFFAPKQNEADPYQQMADAFASYISSTSRIADFGCGSGQLLTQLRQQYAIPYQQLIGVDFQNHLSKQDFQFIPADLNQVTSLDSLCAPVDIATASHTLEHVHDPIQFLSLIKHSLKPQGILFIEVPDCSPNIAFDGFTRSNTVIGQHIQYFTTESLTRICRMLGFNIISTNQIRSRYSRRLQVVAQLVLPSDTNTEYSHNRLSLSARTAIEMHKQQEHELTKILYQTAKDTIKREGKVALWGVGGEFFRLFKRYSECYSLLEVEKIILFDRDHAGKTFAGTTIRHSSELTALKWAVIHTPLFQVTRENMESYASKNGIKLLNGYAN
jgi:SAM-dependent methyltransferase